MKAVILLFSLLFVFNNTRAQKSESNLVRKSFEDYKTAILNDEGGQAVQFVDSRTIAYYSKMLDLVKTADSGKVNSLSILDKLMVLAVRHRTGKADILSFDGRALFVHAIKSGMVGKSSVADNSIGEVTINGHFAKGQFLYKGQKTPIFFHFYKEQEQWKVDLTSIFGVSTVAFENMAKESGETENDYILHLLEMISGEKPGSEVWLPVGT